jgi:adenosylcobinamide-phosphate synthase
MLGYRDPVHEYLGKGAARLDDAAGYVPARLAGLLLVAAAWLKRENAGGAWDFMKAQHSLTASPNAGWTMSAAAGALGIKLEKEGHYRLGSELSSPSAEDISRAVGLVKTAYILFVVVVLLMTMGIHYGSGT